MQQFQQQQQQQVLIGHHQNMGQLAGPQLSQLSQSSVMVFPGGPVHSAPGLVLGHHQPEAASISPNSTPGLQMPAPAATPPIVNINIEDRAMFLNGVGRIVASGHGMEKINLEGGGQIPEAEQTMIWKGVQEMFPAVDRFPGLMPSSAPGHGFPTTSAAAAVAAQIQAQENLLRLQQQQQQQQQHRGGPKHQQQLGFHSGPHPGLPPAQIMTQVISFRNLSSPSCQYNIVSRTRPGCWLPLRVLSRPPLLPLGPRGRGLGQWAVTTPRQASPRTPPTGSSPRPAQRRRTPSSSGAGMRSARKITPQVL